MSMRAALRLLAGAGVLAVVLGRVGTGPFVDAADSVDARALAAAVAIAIPTTLCCAWRWTLVARGLGVPVPLRAAVASCYRSQFLNTTLPGGVLGDVHRGVRHGREVGDTGRALRAVGWERVAGQVVQAALTLLVLLVLPSPLRPVMPYVAAGVVGAGALALLARRWPRSAPLAPAVVRRTLRAVVRDVRSGVLAPDLWPGVVLASALALAGYVLTFLLAARTAGSGASYAELVPLALLVLVAMAVPANVAGWGPREGVAAWAFASVGLGAAAGVTTAVVYGVLVLVASLPGAVVLLVDRRRVAPASAVPVPARLDGAVRG